MQLEPGGADALWRQGHARRSPLHPEHLPCHVAGSPPAIRSPPPGFTTTSSCWASPLMCSGRHGRLFDVVRSPHSVGWHRERRATRRLTRQASPRTTLPGQSDTPARLASPTEVTAPTLMEVTTPARHDSPKAVTSLLPSAGVGCMASSAKAWRDSQVSGGGDIDMERAGIVDLIDVADGAQ